MNALLLAACLIAQPPIVYISGPHGRTSIANTNQAFYEHPDGCDLKVRWADGKVETLVEWDDIVGGKSITDPCVSLDGRSVLYVHLGTDSRGARIGDVWRLQLDNRQTIRLTNATAEWSPSRETINYAPHPTPLNAAERKQWMAAGLAWMSNQYGVWNTAPCELTGGLIAFTSNRSCVEPTKINLPALQLYVMDADGTNVQKIGHLNLGGALHPTALRNGKIAFSSGEMQGYRTAGMWGIWDIAPDGGQFSPQISSYHTFAAPFHFQTETSDGSLVASQYYQNRTYGALFVAPRFDPSPFGPPTMFGFPEESKNPLVANGWNRGGTGRINKRYAFQRRGLFNLVPDQTTQDWNPATVDGLDAGASTHPAATPGNGLLFAMRRGPRDTGEIGIYYVPDVSRTYQPSELVKVVDEPGVMECFPRALVPYSAIHGISEPARFESPSIYSPRDEDGNLPPGALDFGEPYGVVGTSSLAWRETKGNPVGKEAQGGDRGVDTADIEYIGILAQQPNEAFVRHANLKQTWENYFNERTALMQPLIPITKRRMPDGSINYGPGPEGTAIIGPDGQRDTSFAAEVPANSPWTFVYLDRDQNVLGLAQTWHQVIPGEKYTTCGGCHAHNRPAPFDFESAFAADGGYHRLRVANVGRVAEWQADIKPILDRACADCHADFNRKSLYERNLAGRDFISRQAMLVKRIYGYDGVKQCPPADRPQLTAEEKRTISWWVGTGMTEAKP